MFHFGDENCALVMKNYVDGIMNLNTAVCFHNIFNILLIESSYVTNSNAKAH